MNNRTIAVIFMSISWAMFVMTMMLGFPLFIIYSIACIALSHIVYHRENSKT